MDFLWRKKMDNTPNNHNCCNIECYQCKKIFMALVLLILTFMAGIMVGNCSRCHYSDDYYQNLYAKKHKKDFKKIHRGMHFIPQSQPDNTSAMPDNGGFIIEVEQSN